MKSCPTCGETKEESAFGKNRAKPDGLQSQCRTCTKIKQHRWYVKHKDVHYAEVQQRRNMLADKLSEQLFNYLKEHPCVDCGESDPIVLHLDHVRGEKDFDVSAAVSHGYSWQKMQAEIAKCEVRCANCHTRKTAKQFGFRRALLANLLNVEDENG